MDTTPAHAEPSDDMRNEPAVPDGIDPAIYTSWIVRHGEDGARRLADAERFADAVGQAVIPENTTRTYDKGWLVWERFCADQNLPPTEGSRGALVAYVAWLLDRGRQTPGPNGALGYAPSSANAHLTAAIVGLRARGHEVSKDAHAEARSRLESLATKLAVKGDRRGRGQAHAADLDNLYRIATSCPDTLTGRRDVALVLTGFHFASRASEVSGLLLPDITVHPEGIIVAVVSGKTRRSVRSVAIPFNNDDPEICAARAWQRWADAYRAPDHLAPAFPWIDRWGNVCGPLSPAGVSEAVARVAERSGVPLRWTGHSLRSGLATEGRKAGADPINLAAQGGWAPNSKSMLGYMRRADQWTDNATAGLRRNPTGQPR